MPIKIYGTRQGLPVSRRTIGDLVEFLLRAQGIAPHKAFIEISFVGERRLKYFFKRYLGRHASTGVLTFDLSTAQAVVGTVVVSPGYIRTIAREYRSGFKEELLRYVAHGVLNLRAVSRVRTARALRAKTYALLTKFLKGYEAKSRGKR
jgi:ssRNA-specific RNase YbeY (16S rRNA maturation enzyme)